MNNEDRLYKLAKNLREWADYLEMYPKHNAPLLDAHIKNLKEDMDKA